MMYTCCIKRVRLKYRENTVSMMVQYMYVINCSDFLFPLHWKSNEPNREE